VLLIGGGNDVVATHLHLSINAITWFVRISFFVMPVIAFVITKRVCMGLQRRDRDKVLHGRESGLIKMLPHGEYVEVHEPLTPAERFRLTQHEQEPPYAMGPLVDANGVERQVKGGQRVRAGSPRRCSDQNAQIPKPTVEEYKELTSGEHHH
jgi:ubiquinol-cytochrome c reductase cytochrome b subunit